MLVFVRVKTIIPHHFEVFFRNVTDKFFDKFDWINSSRDKLVVLVTFVVKSV
jgi:hypothetical protein